MKRAFIIFFVILLTVVSGFSQVSEDIEQFEEENGKNYIKPLAYAVGANLNSGLFQTAKVLKPFGFGVVLNSMLAFVPEKDKTFMAIRPDLKDPMSGTPLYSPDEIESATIFGNEGGQFNFSGDPLQFTNEEDIQLPNGLNMSVAPILVPQFNLGVPFGNEIMIRYFPNLELSPEIGALSFYGFAFKHSLNKSLLKLLPLNLAVQTAFHSLSIGDVLEIKTFSVNGEISKNVFNWTFFGGVGWETTNLHAHYVSDAHLEIGGQYPYYSVNPVPTDIEFDIKGINGLRMSFGIGYHISVVDVNLSSSLGNYPTVNLGIGFSL